MLSWAIAFLVFALIAGAFGFRGAAGMALFGIGAMSIGFVARRRRRILNCTSRHAASPLQT